MKYLPIIFLMCVGCADFQRVLDVAGTVAPPIGDAFQPGLGTAIGAIVGGVSVIGGGIATIIAKTKKRK